MSYTVPVRLLNPTQSNVSITISLGFAAKFQIVECYWHICENVTLRYLIENMGF